MSSSVVKIVTGSLFREELQKAFLLQRDLRSCLSLKNAELLVAQRQHEILSFGKTVFLQFLNNYPLNYNYKSLSGSLKLFVLPTKFENCSIYQQMMKYTIFLKLKEYAGISQKKYSSQLIHQQQNVLMQLIKHQSFDTVQAMNFLLLQKDNTNVQLFYHALQKFKSASYESIIVILPKITPILLKRLTLNEWNIIRRFKFLIDYIAMDYIPGDYQSYNFSFLLEKISILQLHTVGYSKIPPSIDYIIGYFVKFLENSGTVDINKLQRLLEAFQYLPLGYNEYAFNLFFKKLLERAGNQSIFINKLPYRRMNESQIKAILSKVLSQKTIFNDIIYYGHHSEARKMISKHEKLPQLQKQFFTGSYNHKKFVTNYVISAKLLLQYETDNDKKQKIKQRIKQVLLGNENHMLQIMKYFTLCAQFDLIYLIKLLNIQTFGNNRMKLYIKQMIEKANKQYKQLPYLNMLDNLIILNANSHQQDIRQLIKDILAIVINKNTKFYFKSYSIFLFELARSQYSSQYQSEIQLMLQKLEPADCPYFIQMYNRYPKKNIRLYNQILKNVWKKHPSFESIGKLMVTSNYVPYTSSQGELKLEMRDILQKIEPILHINQVKQFLLPQLQLILKFCHHFYFYISNLARKILLFSLKILETIDFKKEGVKSILGLLQQLSLLSFTAKSNHQFSKKIVSSYNKLVEEFPDSFILKIKFIECKWILGQYESDDRKQLITQQILGQLSSSNYSVKHIDIIISLLKLHAFDVLKLNKVIEQKLQQVVLNALDEGSVKMGDIVNNINIPFGKEDIPLNNKNAEALNRILIASLDKIQIRQNLDYKLRFAQFGHFCRDSELVSRSLKSLSHNNFYPAQIKKVVHLLKFYKNIDGTQICLKLIQQAYNHTHSILFDLTQLLYNIHFLVNNISPKHEKMSEKIIELNEEYLIKCIKKQEINTDHRSHYRLVAFVVKHIWVSLKTNRFTSSTSVLSKYLIDNFDDVKKFSKKGSFEGVLTWDIAIIYIAIIKSLVKQSNYIPASHNQKAKSFFSQKSNQQNIETEKTKNLLSFNYNVIQSLSMNFFPKNNQQQLIIFLEKSGLKRSNQTKDKNNIFTMNKFCNEVILNAWVIKDNIQYGILFLDDRYFNIQKGQKGRINFNLNSLKLITKLPILPFYKGTNKITFT